MLKEDTRLQVNAIVFQEACDTITLEEDTVAIQDDIMLQEDTWPSLCQEDSLLLEDFFMLQEHSQSLVLYVDANLQIVSLVATSDEDFELLEAFLQENPKPLFQKAGLDNGRGDWKVQPDMRAVPGIYTTRTEWRYHTALLEEEGNAFTKQPTLTRVCKTTFHLCI